MCFIAFKVSSCELNYSVKVEHSSLDLLVIEGRSAILEHTRKCIVVLMYLDAGLVATVVKNL
jgi:hypothetical protein